MKLSKLNFLNIKVRTTSAVDNVKNREHACIIGGTVNCSYCEVSVAVPQHNCSQIYSVDMYPKNLSYIIRKIANVVVAVMFKWGV